MLGIFPNASSIFQIMCTFLDSKANAIPSVHSKTNATPFPYSRINPMPLLHVRTNTAEPLAHRFYRGNVLFPAIFTLPSARPPVCTGPFFMSSESPRSFHAASLVFWVALWIPNAACWSGTISSSSSGFKGWFWAGTKISSSGSLSLQKSSKRSASRGRLKCIYVWLESLDYGCC